MPIRNINPAYEYGLSLMGQRPPAGATGAAGFLGSAVPMIVQALMMREGYKQQEARSAQYGDALLGYQQNVQNELIPTGVQATPPVQMGEDPSLRDYSGVVQKQSQGDAMASALLHSKNPDLINSLAPMIMQQQAQDASRADDRNMAMGSALMGQRFQRGQQIGQQDFAADQAQAGRDFTAGQTDKTLAAQTDIAAANRDAAATQAELNRRNAQEVAGIRAGSTGGNVQSVQQIQLPNGQAGLLTVFRDGKREVTTVDGQPVISSQRDPGALYNQRAAGAGGQAAGAVAESLPTVDANFNIINKTLDEFDLPEVKKQAPYALGWGSMAPTVPGWNTDFRARKSQLQGQTFLQAYNTLRGGGQITEVEGAKAEGAIARLNDAQTEGEFYKALSDAKTTFAEIHDAIRIRAQRGAVVPQMQPQTAPANDGWQDMGNGIRIREKR